MKTKMKTKTKMKNKMKTKTKMKTNCLLIGLEEVPQRFC